MLYVICHLFAWGGGLIQLGSCCMVARRGPGKKKKQQTKKLGKKEGMTQGRGADSSGEKCRVTMEFRQGVSGYFSNQQGEVAGHILPSVLVLKGAYGILSNIDDEHYFKETMVFIVGGKQITHEMGKTSGPLMYSLVELRKKEPQLFEGLIVCQQPSAWMDEIIQSWIIADTGERTDQAVHQRDLFAAALTPTAKKLMKVYQTIPAWIAAKMTPVLQLTDTHIVFPAKAAATRFKEQLAREMRAAAKLEGRKEEFHCGTKELIKVAKHIHDFMVDMNTKDDIVLKGLRANGMLCWKPMGGKLERADVDEKLRAHPVGQHRMKHSWLKNRYQWLDEKGRPKPADWNRSESAQELEDLQEQDYCYKEMQDCEMYVQKIAGKKIKVPVFNIDSDSQNIFGEEDALLSLHPKLRRQIKAGTAGKRDAKSLIARAAQKKVEKQRVQEALSNMEDDWNTYLSESLIFKCRKDLAKELIPEVRGKKRTKATVVKTKYSKVTQQVNTWQGWPFDFALGYPFLLLSLALVLLFCSSVVPLLSFSSLPPLLLFFCSSPPLLPCPPLFLPSPLSLSLSLSLSPRPCFLV